MTNIHRFCYSLLTASFLLASSTNLNAQLNLELPDTSTLPTLGSSASETINQRQEAELGKELYRNLRQRRPLIQDPELNAWIQSLGNRLALNSPVPVGDLYFAIEKNDSMNARTMLGGVIVVHSGLILATESESELASVIAHEIAHVSQQHITRLLANNQNSPLLTGLGLLAGAIAASQSDSPQAAQTVMTGAMALQAHRQIGFSQRAESEADRIGIRTLAAAQLNPNALPRFLEKLDRQNSSPYDDISKYLRTHPLSIERISDTRHLVSQTSQRPYQEQASYVFAREKLAQISGNNSAPLRQSVPPDFNNYSLALKAFRSGQYAKVINYLNKPTTQLAPNLLVAEALNQLKRYSETVQRLRPLHGRYPHHEALNMLLAEALAEQKQVAQAIQLLLRLRQQETTSTEFFEHAQRIAQQHNFPAEARLFNAERSLRLGQYKHAQATLKQLERLPNTSPTTAVAIRQRQRDLIQMQQTKERLEEL